MECFYQVKDSLSFGAHFEETELSRHLNKSILFHLHYVLLFFVKKDNERVIYFDLYWYGIVENE